MPSEALREATRRRSSSSGSPDRPAVGRPARRRERSRARRPARRGRRWSPRRWCGARRRPRASSPRARSGARRPGRRRPRAGPRGPHGRRRRAALARQRRAGAPLCSAVRRRWLPPLTTRLIRSSPLPLGRRRGRRRRREPREAGRVERPPRRTRRRRPRRKVATISCPASPRRWHRHRGEGVRPRGRVVERRAPRARGRAGRPFRRRAAEALAATVAAAPDAARIARWDIRVSSGGRCISRRGCGKGGREGCLASRGGGERATRAPSRDRRSSMELRRAFGARGEGKDSQALST